MWISNLKELKTKSGMTAKQLADKTNLPERTIKRILNGETDHPRIDTLYLIVTAMDATLNDIFADTNVIVATETLAEVKEEAIQVEAEKEIALAEKDLAVAENEMLKTKVLVLTQEIELLKKDLQHKDELLALVNYFTKIKPQ
jgi:transcriptional regulator with XRE-family HTH domain